MQALVPPRQGKQRSGHDGDLFYPDIIEEAKLLKAKGVLLEVSDLDQARRVATMAVRQQHWIGIEIWRDDPASRSAAPKETIIDGKLIPVRGSGHGRSVLLYGVEGATLLGKGSQNR